MVWYFSQSQASSCGRWQKTQPVLSVCFIPKECHIPRDLSAFWKCFWITKEDPHPSCPSPRIQSAGHTVGVQLATTPTPLIYAVPQQQFSMSHDKTNNQRSFLSQDTFDRICFSKNIWCGQTKTIFLSLLPQWPNPVGWNIQVASKKRV